MVRKMKNFTERKELTETFQELLCSTTFINGIHEGLRYLSAINTFLSIIAFLGNILILVALRKESSLHPPSKLLFRCLATTDFCVGLIAEPHFVAYNLSLIHEDWNLCHYTIKTTFAASYILSSVSLLTLTAISVDRLLALSLGLRHRQVANMKRTYVVVIIFWVVPTVAVVTSLLINELIALWYGYIGITLCLVTSIFSYTKIFRALRHNHNQIHDHVQQQQQPSQPITLNMARYRKALYSALWVQLALVVCYLPYGVVTALLYSKLSSSYMVAWSMTATLVYFNSSLNPFLYCWKIKEVRQAVKKTIREALCFLRS